MKKINDHNKTKIPWPTKNAMEQVYEMKLWGDNQTEFYSGEGSHRPEIVIPYINAVANFLRSFEQPLVVCDLGCGDFNIGKELLAYSKQYVAIDIVESLIERNKAKFQLEHLSFECLDLAVDDLPAGDCAILRQVLQHLSNKEIQNILDKLNNYKYVILTEHLPNEQFEPNIDIISGQGIRLKKKSGVDVLAPPFNFEVKKSEKMVSTVLPDEKGVIATTLYTLF